MRNPIHFTGLLKAPVSWAKVSRELISALARQGEYVSAVSLKGFLYDESFPLRGEVADAVAGKRLPGWDIALDYPPNFSRLSGKHRAGILIYEAGRFPNHWAEAAAKYLDIALVPSRFTLEAAVASGVPREILAVVPFGVNTDTYRPDGRAAALTDRAVNFLAVAAPHVRKGLAELTEAFCRAFTADDDVGLLIKCPPLAGLGRRPWEYSKIADFIPDGRHGQVVLREGALSEEEMAALYRAADVYCQPSWGESFGLAPLEALACGVPVIATGWGGVLDFLDESNAWLCGFEIVDGAAFAYDWRTEAPARMARPRVGHLAELLRQAACADDARRSKGQAGIRTAEGLTWEQSARTLVEALGRRLS